MRYYINCPICGKKLCRLADGSEIEMKCPSCSTPVEGGVKSGTVNIKQIEKLATQKK
jgi:phage FluMu protein Com